MKKVFLPQLCKTYWKHQYSCGWIFFKNWNVYLKRKPWRVSIRLMFNTQFQSKVNGGASATIAAALQHWLVLSCQRKSLDFFWFNCFNERARDGRRRQRGCLTHKKKKKAGREMGGRASEWSDSSSVWLRWLMETDGRRRSALRPAERPCCPGLWLLTLWGCACEMPRSAEGFQRRWTLAQTRSLDGKKTASRHTTWSCRRGVNEPELYSTSSYRSEIYGSALQPP